MAERLGTSRGGALFGAYWQREGAQDAQALAAVLTQLHDEARALIHKAWQDGFMAATTQIADRGRRKGEAPEETP